jgi:hypothetical protein
MEEANVKYIRPGTPPSDGPAESSDPIHQPKSETGARKVSNYDQVVSEPLVVQSCGNMEFGNSLPPQLPMNNSDQDDVYSNEVDVSLKDQDIGPSLADEDGSNLTADYTSNRGTSQNISDFDIARPPGSRASYPPAFIQPQVKHLSLTEIMHSIVDGNGHLLFNGTSSISRYQSKLSRRGSQNLSNVSSSSALGVSVRFGNLHIREYERALGDSPCSAGPPISIGWKYRVFDNNRGRYSAEFVDDRPDGAMTEIILPLEKYEQLRGPRAPVHDLILSRFARESLLIENGVARSELAEAVRQNIKVKNQRRQTVTNLALAPIEERFERWARIFRKLTIIDSSKRQKAKSRHLLDRWVDDSKRSGSASGTTLTYVHQSTSIKGILIKDPEARRREKTSPSSHPLNKRQDSLTSSMKSEEISFG